MASKKGAFSMILGVTDKVSGPLKKINSSIEKVTKPINKVKFAFKRLGRQAGLKKLKKSVGALKDSVGNLASTVGGLALKFGALAGVAGGAILSVVKKTADFGDNLAKTSDRIGLSAKALQQWRFVAERSGVSTDNMDKAFEGFSKRLGEARAGTGSLYTILNKANPALLSQLKNAKGNEQAFTLMMRAMAGANNEQVKAALGSAAFGRVGVKLINVANNGADGIEKLKKRAEELGLVTDDQARGSETYIDTLFDLKMAFQGIWQQVSFQVMPVLNKLFGQLTTWFVKNRPLVIGFAQEFAKKLPDAIKKTAEFFQSLWQGLKPIFSFVQKFTEILGGFGNVLKILGVLILAKVAIALWGVATALAGVGAAIMTTPIGWVIAGLTALVAVIALVAKNIENIRGWFRSLGPALKVLLSPIWGIIEGLNLIAKGFSKLSKLAINNLVPDSMKSLFGLGSEKAKPENTAKNILRAQAQSQTASVQGNINVDFLNVPQGTSIESNASEGLSLNTNAGFAMGL